jgi:hypothetical protein
MGGLKGENLVAALGELASAEATIRSALADEASTRKTAAAKQATAIRKHADAVKDAADKTREAAQEAAQRLREATQRARDQIGALFQGPILAPTEAARKRALGVPGTDIGRLTADIRAQTRAGLAFQRDLARISRAGGPAQLVAELRRGNLVEQAATIAAAARPEQRELFREFARREAAARRIAERPLRVFLTVNLDGKQVAHSVTTHQQRTGRHQGRQRRGRHGGQALGLA